MTRGRALRVQRRRGRWFFAGLLVAIGTIDVGEAFVVHNTTRPTAVSRNSPVARGGTATVRSHGESRLSE